MATKPPGAPPAHTDAATPPGDADAGEPDLHARIVAALTLDAATRERARDQPFTFEVTAPLQIRVVNERYPTDERADHTYTVVVGLTDGLIVPLHCDCPACMYHDGDCKHMAAVAIDGGPVLLGAAFTATGDRDHDRDHTDETTLADHLGLTDTEVA